MNLSKSNPLKFCPRFDILIGKNRNIRMRYLIKFLILFILICAGVCSDDKPEEPFVLCPTCSCSDNSTGSDPLFDDQWHLDNTGQNNGTVGEDINVAPAWDLNNKGDTVLIAIVDNGLDYAHEDLSPNVIRSYNYNYATGSSNINSGDHGTCVAGLAAAREKNNAGVRGVAPCANLAGYNLLVYSTVSTEYDAMVRNKSKVGVSNNSWGPPDYTGQLTPSNSSWQDGIDEGINTGRNGLGIVYVWAAGNAGLYPFNNNGSTVWEELDNSNYDGYANYYGVIAVGSVDKNGERSYYSEKGANIWVCTHAGNNLSYNDGLTTTDISGYNSEFTGTSAAAPLASGVAALMLRANPNLTWRDVRLILAETARKNDSDDSDWTTNGAGHNINHKYGFGVADAGAAVNRAADWTNVGEFKNYTKSYSGSSVEIAYSNTSGASSTVAVSSSGITSIEFISITVNITHNDSGDLEISVESPENTISVLSEKHDCFDITSGALVSDQCDYFSSGASHAFGSARCLGESADGDWTLTIQDLDNNSVEGDLNSWSIKFYGR